MARSPGVYPVEVEKSQTTVGFAGSIGAVVVDTDRGPVGPKLITSPARLVENYGEPKQDEFALHSALRFIRNASELWVRRVIQENDQEASVDVTNDGNTADDTNTIFTINAENPGEWGNGLEVHFAEYAKDDELFYLTVFENGVEVEEWLVSRVSDKKDGYGQPAYIEDRINENSMYITVNDKTDVSGLPHNMRVQVTDEDISVSEATSNTTKDFEITFSNLSTSETLTDIEEIVVRIGGQRGKDVIKDTDNSVIAFDVDDPDAISTTNDTATVTYWEPSTNISLSGGATDSNPIEESDIQKAWDDFWNSELYTIRILLNGGFTMEGVQDKMTRIAENRQDCIAVLDTPEDARNAEAIAEYSDDILNINSSFAALYCGWPYVSDQFSGKRMYLPPSGFVGSVMSQTESQGESWYAPAGLRRGTLNVLGVNVNLDQGGRDLVYRSNVNPIVEFSGQGVAVWGQKTLKRQASATDRVNVRMLLIEIMDVASRTLNPFIFELNNVTTRNNIESILTDYMSGIYQRGGTYDFSVICNRSNNPSQVIDSNELNVDIYIQPVQVAETINLSVIITRSGINFATVQ